MSDVIDIQVKAPSCQKEHQRPVSVHCGFGGPGGSTTRILNKMCLLLSSKNDLEIACRQKTHKQPQFLLFCQPLPGQPKNKKNERNWT